MCDAVEVKQRPQPQRWQCLPKDARRHALERQVIVASGTGSRGTSSCTRICSRTSDGLGQHQAVNDDARSTGEDDAEDDAAADVLSEMTFTLRMKNMRGRLRRSSVSMETGDRIAQRHAR